MKNVKITISAECGCGKSTITFIILKALKQHGLDVDFNDLDYPSKNMFIHDMQRNISDRAIGLQDKIHIDIEQVQLARKPLNNE